MGALLETLRNLGPMRLAIVGVVVLGLIGFFIFLTTRLTGTQMALLYGQLPVEDLSRIVAQLDSSNVPFELRRNGTQIFVPADQVVKLRMSMAGQGLPSGGTVGYEIFDKAEALGTTNFT